MNAGKLFAPAAASLLTGWKAQPSEWRAFTVDEFYSKSRAGGPTSLARYNKGLLTSIGSSSKRNSFGANIDRIRVWDFRIQVANDRSLRQALPELDHLREDLGLPDPIVEKSAYITEKQAGWA